MKAEMSHRVGEGAEVLGVLKGVQMMVFNEKNVSLVDHNISRQQAVSHSFHCLHSPVLGRVCYFESSTPFTLRVDVYHSGDA